MRVALRCSSRCALPFQAQSFEADHPSSWQHHLIRTSLRIACTTDARCSWTVTASKARLKPQTQLGLYTHEYRADAASKAHSHISTSLRHPASRSHSKVRKWTPGAEIGHHRTAPNASAYYRYPVPARFSLHATQHAFGQLHCCICSMQLLRHAVVLSSLGLCNGFAHPRLLQRTSAARPVSYSRHVTRAFILRDREHELKELERPALRDSVSEQLRRQEVARCA